MRVQGLEFKVLKLIGRRKIPVTVITGFLGAGKTTFINNLLEKYTKLQFALLENEFGEVAIDSKLIKGVDSSQLFELKQGCICCTIVDEYELILEELAERFTKIDHLIIETTGVADPAPVIQPFLSDENLKQIYEFNGTICLVDAKNFENQAEKEIRLKQLAISDLVLINKTEKLSDNEKQLLKQKIANKALWAQIDLIIYGNSDTVNLDTIEQSKTTRYWLAKSSASHGHIQTKTIYFKNALNRHKFLRWLEYTLDIYKNEIYRCKGIVCFQSEPFEYVIQGVGGSFEISEGDFISENTKSELVFIGKLEAVELQF